MQVFLTYPDCICGPLSRNQFVGMYPSTRWFYVKCRHIGIDNSVTFHGTACFITVGDMFLRSETTSFEKNSYFGV